MSKINPHYRLVSEDTLNGWQTLVNQLADAFSVTPAVIVPGRTLDSLVCRVSDTRYQLSNDTLSLKDTFVTTELEAANRSWPASSGTTFTQRRDLDADLPLQWPDGQMFGAICVLDIPSNATSRYRHFLQGVQLSIEAHLKSLYQQQTLLLANQELQSRLQNRTQDLAALNFSLNQEMDRRQAAESQLNYQRLHDSGTGFFNQQGLETELHSHLSTETLPQIAVLHLGFANGRHLQARFGYQGWEQILQLYARQITSPANLELSIARPSATDLVLLVCATHLRQPLDALCHQLLNLHQNEWEWQQQRFHLHAHVGIATSLDSRNVHALLEHAHGAMLVCKDSGYGFHYHASETEQTLSPGGEFAGSLQQALQGDEIVMLFVPKVQPDSRQWIGAQPQLRWSHPQLGDIRHDSLMLMAKQNSQSTEVGNFILRHAIETASRWHKQFRDIRIAIPLSSGQLENGQLARHVEALLNAHDISAPSIELEIPEQALLGDKVTVRNTLQSLHQLGVHLTLSEFGSGPTSFHQLKMLPFDGIKLDKHFMRQLSSDQGDPSTLRSVIHIAKKLGLQIALEGIDHPAQETFFGAEGCDVAQGSLYAQPLAAEEFELVMFNQRESIAK